MRLPAGEQARRERAQRRAAVLRWTEVTGARQRNALLPHQGGSDPVGKGEFWRWKALGRDFSP